MTDDRTITEHGGITLQPNDASFPLRAATFAHAMLPGRNIVKLIPEPPLEAETLALAVSGIEFKGSTRVGHIQRRGTGFPAWPVLTDPKNARHALNLVADLKRATRLAKSKPGTTKANILALATTLEESAPHFLPTFLEEAARAYLRAGNIPYAAHMFTRAREIERRYAVPIDETRHRDVFLEFAYAGAINHKELTAEASSLSRRLEPAEALERFRTLCIECAHSGLSPHASLKKDVAKLAKAAGLDPAEEEARLIRELLRTSSVEYAAPSFWKNYYPAIRRAAQHDAELREHLLTLQPRNAEPDAWIDLLQATGSLELVKQGTHPEFVPLILTFASQHKSGRTQANAKLAPLLAELLPQAGCTSMGVERGTLSQIPPEASEQLAAHGVRLTVHSGPLKPFINVANWAYSENRAPLPHLIADEQYRQYIINGIDKNLTDPDVMSAVAADPYLRPLVIELLTAKVELLEASAPTVDRLVGATRYVRGFEAVNDEQVQNLLDRVRTYHKDPAEVLAETLRRGLLEELGWHEFEKAYGSVESHDFSNTNRAQDCWPGVVVYNNNQATYVSGRTTRDIPHGTDEPIIGATEVDGQFALLTLDRETGEEHINWPASGARLPVKQHSGSGHLPGGSVPVPGGRLIDSKTVIRPDHHTWNNRNAQFFVEEDRIWILQHDRTLVEIDPETGAEGPQSMPEWIQEQCKRHPDLIFQPFHSQLRPVTEATTGSPFSTAQGYHRHAVFYSPNSPDFALIVDTDGTEYPITGEDAQRASGVVRLPDGQPRILLRTDWGYSLLHPEDGATTRYYGVDFNTALWWHHTRPRDPQLSSRLRTITADHVRPALEYIAANIAAAGDSKQRRKLYAEVSNKLGVNSPALCSAVIQHARNVLESWPQPDVAGPLDTLPDAPTFEQHHAPLTSLLSRYWFRIKVKEIWDDTAKLGLHQYPLSKTNTTETSANESLDFGASGTHVWSELLGATDGLLALAALPDRTAEEIQGLKELWLVMRTAGVVDAADLVVDEIEPPEDVAVDYTFSYPSSVLISDYSRRPLQLLRKASDGPVVIDGNTCPEVNRREFSPGRTDLEPIFDALLERVTENGPAPWSPEPGIAFAEATGMPVANAHLVMVGFPNFNADFVNFMPKELRTTMGLKVNEVTEARARLNEFQGDFLSVLAAGVPEDPAELLDQGLDVHAMAARWPGTRTALGAAPPECLDRIPKHLPSKTVESVLAGEHSEEDWTTEVAAVLWLAHELDLSDARRAALAGYVEELIHSPSGLDDVNAGSIFDDAHLQRTMGFTIDDALQSSRFRVEATDCTLRDRLRVDLTGIDDPEDPDLHLARRWCTENYGDMGTLTALNLTLSGRLSTYAQWLRGKYDGGDPHDPLAVVPQLVAKASTTLGVSEDAARYYLQLLAWPDPTDANVRRWNSWQKAEITAAGKELLALDVVVEAKRSRSRRSFFLQGSWVEAVPPHLPLESWKVEPFAMRLNAAGSKYEPGLGVPLAPLPAPEWFAACWERSQGEDAPRFSDLKTTRGKR